MPLYTYLCNCGYAAELRRARSARAVACPQCGGRAKRDPVPRGSVGIAGFRVTPVSQRYVPVSRAMEAHETILHEAAKAGVQPPDLYAAGIRQAAWRRRNAPETIGE